MHLNRESSGAPPVNADTKVVLIRRATVWFQVPLTVGELLLHMQGGLTNVFAGYVAA